MMSDRSVTFTSLNEVEYLAQPALAVVQGLGGAEYRGVALA